MAQSVKCLTSAQVMISWLLSSRHVLVSMLMAQSLEPASDSVSPSLSLPLPPADALSLSLSLSLSKINKNIFKKFKKKLNILLHVGF